MFRPLATEVARGYGRFCGMSCKSSAQCDHLRIGRNGIGKRAQVRANGLINMRIRRGTNGATRPGACEICAKVCKPDAHHPDYTLPALVWFLCRSCHMKVHHGTLALPARKVVAA